jgi:hypothetical protein
LKKPKSPPPKKKKRKEKKNPLHYYKKPFKRHIEIEGGHDLPFQICRWSVERESKQKPRL